MGFQTSPLDNKRPFEQGNSSNSNKRQNTSNYGGNGGHNSRYKNNNFSRNGGNSSNQSQQKNGGHSGNSNYRGGRNGGNNGNRSSIDNSSQRTTVCRRCNKDHKGKTCDGRDLVCYNCRSTAHKAFECTPANTQKSGGNGNRNRSNGGNGCKNINYYGGNGNNNYRGNGKQSQGAPSTNPPNSTPHVAPSGGPYSAGTLFVLNATKAANVGNCLTGTFDVKSVPAFILFDSGASHSFVSKTFSAKLESIPASSLDEYVSVPSGTDVKCSKVYNDVSVKIASTDFSANLIEFNHLICYDVILDWDFIKKYEAKIECALEKITLKGKHGKQVSYRKLPHKSKVKLVCCF